MNNEIKLLVYFNKKHRFPFTRSGWTEPFQPSRRARRVPWGAPATVDERWCWAQWRWPLRHRVEPERSNNCFLFIFQGYAMEFPLICPHCFIPAHHRECCCPLRQEPPRTTLPFLCTCRNCPIFLLQLIESVPMSLHVKLIQYASHRRFKGQWEKEANRPPRNSKPTQRHDYSRIGKRKMTIIYRFSIVNLSWYMAVFSDASNTTIGCHISIVR